MTEISVTDPEKYPHMVSKIMEASVKEVGGKILGILLALASRTDVVGPLGE